MNSVKSHLTFNRSQRDGILFLVLLILIMLGLLLFADFSKPATDSFSAEEIRAIQRKFDSLKLLKQASEKPGIYPFNPNFITEYKAYTLGMTPAEFDRLREYRDSGLWINSAEDFRKVTKISESLHLKISPYFKFPEWVNRPRTTRKQRFDRELAPSEKKDLNKASREALTEVYGVGKVLSDRIIRYGEKIGGYKNDMQLYEVYGLSDMAVAAVLKRFTVKNPRDLQKYNVNTATASDLATLPGIDFELAKEIWEFIRLREGIDDLAELQKIESMSEQKFRLIALYLYAK